MPGMFEMPMLPGMPGTQGMPGMTGMQGMTGMPGMLGMQGTQGMQATPGMHVMQPMQVFAGMPAMPGMPGMSMPGSPSDMKGQQGMQRMPGHDNHGHDHEQWESDGRLPAAAAAETAARWALLRQKGLPGTRQQQLGFNGAAGHASPSSSLPHSSSAPTLRRQQTMHHGNLAASTPALPMAPAGMPQRSGSKKASTVLHQQGFVDKRDKVAVCQFLHNLADHLGESSIMHRVRQAIMQLVGFSRKFVRRSL